MLADGLHVLFKGKYIGPPEPGPWAGIMQKLEVDVYKLGPLFIAFGILWLSFLLGYWMGYSWAYPLGLFMSLMTLWYVPVGTFFSLVVFTLLYLTKGEAGF